MAFSLVLQLIGTLSFAAAGAVFLCLTFDIGLRQGQPPRPYPHGRAAPANLPVLRALLIIRPAKTQSPSRDSHRFFLIPSAWKDSFSRAPVGRSGPGELLRRLFSLVFSRIFFNRSFLPFPVSNLPRVIKAPRAPPGRFLFSTTETTTACLKMKLSKWRLPPESSPRSSAEQSRSKWLGKFLCSRILHLAPPKPRVNI